MGNLGLPEGWLVMFDLRATAPWEDRLFIREVEDRNKKIRLVGC